LTHNAQLTLWRHVAALRYTSGTSICRTTSAGGPDGTGDLALETAGGEQRMEFINGGVAQ
jgi:hypothetical protein